MGVKNAVKKRQKENSNQGKPFAGEVKTKCPPGAKNATGGDSSQKHKAKKKE